MKIMAVDDEQYALKDLVETLQSVRPDAEIEGFQTTGKALEYAQLKQIDVAYLDIEMSGMNGLELAKRLKEINPQTNIVFVTGYSEHALDAFTLFASGYILKPVSDEMILDSLEHLRNPISQEEKGLRVQTFGNFQIFFNGEKLHFPRSKAKELFAYLIYKKGTSCTVKELMGILFEDKEYTSSLQSQMQTIISTMMKVLTDVGAEDVVTRTFNHLAVDSSKVNCDYYRFLDWDTDAINAYTGEFMANYSWAEFTVGYLDSKVL